MGCREVKVQFEHRFEGGERARLEGGGGALQTAEANDSDSKFKDHQGSHCVYQAEGMGKRRNRSEGGRQIM